LVPDCEDETAPWERRIELAIQHGYRKVEDGVEALHHSQSIVASLHVSHDLFVTRPMTGTEAQDRQRSRDTAGAGTMDADTEDPS
jgi:hypothetical protein